MADFKQNNINHKPKGRFFWFVYAKGKPKEPSLWFAPVGANKNGTPKALIDAFGGL